MNIILQTGNKLFLNIKIKKTPISPPVASEHSEPPMKKPSILGIGMVGGFDASAPAFEYTHIHQLVVLPEGREIALPDENVPAHIQLSIAAVLKAERSTAKDDFVPWSDAEARQPSAFALSLIQHPNGVQIAPKGWKCTMCEITDNLWLNLTDGTILCGRKNHDGSGGNGHAMIYFQSSGT